MSAATTRKQRNPEDILLIDATAFLTWKDGCTSIAKSNPPGGDKSNLRQLGRTCPLLS